ncbi:GM13254 [Drosophila sechellia]|uniref:GM13254 n=1 Tax=Drosophila sechellia TaxID=7238 RepID=B4ILC0_DROSE|nr:GM13254 [Drosophila sechellia]
MGHVRIVRVPRPTATKNSLHQWLQLRNIVNLCKFSQRRSLCETPMRQESRAATRRCPNWKPPQQCNHQRRRHSRDHGQSRDRSANNINGGAAAAVATAKAGVPARAPSAKGGS